MIEESSPQADAVTLHRVKVEVFTFRCHGKSNRHADWRSHCYTL